nr:hypothetical protein [Tanacetum cinerariifolium]
MLTGKWTAMNREVARFNSLVLETGVMSGENDHDWMTKVEILFKNVTGTEFKHKSAWSFLKENHKGKNFIQQMHEETEDGLPMRNPSPLDTTSCRVHLANKELLRVNIPLTQRMDTRGMDPTSGLTRDGLVDATIISSDLENSGGGGAVATFGRSATFLEPIQGLPPLPVELQPFPGDLSGGFLLCNEDNRRLLPFIHVSLKSPSKVLLALVGVKLRSKRTNVAIRAT